YSVGDAVRKRLAATLRANVLRGDDLLGAMGRDEFVCVLAAVEDSAVAALAAEKSLRALNAPFWIGEDEIFARPAIGIATFPLHGENAESLLQRAKSACAAARGLAGRVAEYARDSEESQTARLLMENRLRTAVSEDTLELVFQPQYDLQLGQIMGAESLLRWREAALGLVPAEEAFSAAEAAGQASALVSSVLNRALRNCSEFRYSAGLDLRIAVNLPARALLHAELPEVVERAVRTWSLRPGRLVIEIGGTSVLADPVARDTLGRLKKIGLKLSIDDPDLALSSLFRLAAMPFQEIKIDVSHANDAVGAAQYARVLQSLIELAHHLKLGVVAVGVPDEAVTNRLKDLGCETMQGDYKGPALEAAAFVARFGVDEE
ncbi:MAG: EAL domain-containing protein, partial [Betaproteobacteria bacterium]|nr:EAL domain-containing protein [Betaproteobacteria bacterium]